MKSVIPLPSDADLIKLARQVANKRFSEKQWQRRISAIHKLASRPRDAREIGRQRLLAVLSHACQTVEYYARHAREIAGCGRNLIKLSDFPVVTNAFLRDHLDNFVSRDYDPGPITVTYSSGSTGRPTPHLKSYNDEYVISQALRRRAETDWGVRRDCEILDLSPRSLTMSGSIAEPLLAVEPGGADHLVWRLRRFDPNDSEAVMEYKRFVRRPFQYAYGAPSRFEGLIAFCSQSKVTPCFSAIVSGFELLSDGLRRSLETLFECPVVNMYGTNEIGIVGWECPSAQVMHVEEDYNFVEILKLDADEPAPDGELGRLVVTSMKSWLMPIIRYDTGDLAAIKTIACPCGRKTRAITRLEGRHSVNFFDFEGCVVRPGPIIDILKNMDFEKFQLAQHEFGLIDINFGINAEENMQIRHDDIMINLGLLELNLSYNIIFDNFEYADSGKFNICVSHL